MRQALFILVAAPTPVFAYLGPGMGAGAFILATAFLAGLFLMALGLIYFPLKRKIKEMSKKYDDKS